jgi:hypothetical protein
VADFTIKANDRLPSIQATLSSGGSALNLATATAVKFIMKTAVGSTIKVNSAATIVTPADGVVRYDWAAIDTDTPGEYVAEWEITWTGGKKQTVPTLTYHEVTVLADLDAS